MGFTGAIRSVLRNPVGLRGRSARPEFWWWSLLAFAINVALADQDATIASLLSLVIAIPTIAVGVRRLHDTDRSGWFYLLIVIPFVNLVLLYFLIKAGTPGSNRFGPPPPPGASPGYRPGPASGSDPGPGWGSPPPPPPPLG
jgi:uncharacterized membrane protein YhaH (DUF805 family)